MNGSSKNASALNRWDVLDFVVMLWRERKLFMIVLGAVLAVGAIAAMLQPKRFESQTRLLVRLGQEYVFQPRVGGAGAGAAPEMKSVVQAELRLLASPEVARRTIEAVGLPVLFPKIAGKADDLGARRTKELAIETFEKSFRVTASPETPILNLHFTHRDPMVAAIVLNAVSEIYLAYRHEILVEPTQASYQAQSSASAKRAAEGAVKLEQMLSRYGIGDFEGEARAHSDLIGKLEADFAAAAASRREALGRVEVLRALMAREPATIELYSESDAAKRLVDLRVEREQLLARYQPGAAPVIEIDRRIKQLEAYLAGETTQGLTRRGVNPVRQEIETKLYEAEAEASAQGARAQAILQQREAAIGRLRTLQTLQPQYQALARQKTILEDQAQTFAARAEEERAFSELAASQTNNIRQLEPATAPTRGASLRFEVLALSGLLALVLATAAACGRGLTRRRFVTSGSAAHALGAPVLGSAAFVVRAA